MCVSRAFLFSAPKNPTSVSECSTPLPGLVLNKHEKSFHFIGKSPVAFYLYEQFLAAYNYTHCSYNYFSLQWNHHKNRSSDHPFEVQRKHEGNFRVKGYLYLYLYSTGNNNVEYFVDKAKAYILPTSDHSGYSPRWPNMRYSTLNSLNNYPTTNNDRM